MNTRICSKCKIEYPLTEEHFRKDPRYREGFKGTCNHGCTYTPEYGRRKQLERRHKMTPAEYDQQLEEQGNHCALCNTVQGDEKRRMAVDHAHECCPTDLTCGKCRRGILCANCNRKIGFLEEILSDYYVWPIAAKEGTWLEKALQYLKKYKP